MHDKRTALAGAMAVILVLGGFSLGQVIQTERVQADLSSSDVARGPAAERSLPSFAHLAAEVSPAVVYIEVVAIEKVAQPELRFPPEPFGEHTPFPGFRSPFPSPFPGELRRRGSGSGFIIRKDGLILTNNHLVEGAKEITVTLADKRAYNATVVGRDPKTDLAVLRIKPKEELSVVQLGDSDALQVGDWVLAIGNPFGLSNTVTVGIVSAKGRVIGAGPYDDFIQTDASINPGNSGGPLFNARGEVIGINSAIFSQSGGNIGIGFAIPINLAKRLLPELETTGSVTRGWLGVSIQKMTAELAYSLGHTQARGALVADVVPGGPAEKAGISRGDVIVTYNGKGVDDFAALPSLVATTPVGDTVPVEVVRAGRTQTLEVTVSKFPEHAAAVGLTP